MKKLKTLRVEEDLLRQMEAIEPNFNKAAVDAFEAYVGPHGKFNKGEWWKGRHAASAGPC